MREFPGTRHSLGAWLSFAAAALFFLFEFVARISPSLDAGHIADWFGLTRAGFGTLSSLFFWVYAPMQLVVGLLLDRYGARWLLPPAIAVCAAGIVLFTATPDPMIGGLGRALTGLGASFAFVGALYVVNHRFAPSRFALLSGLVNAVGMLGTAMGAVWLSRLIETGGWRAVNYGVAGAGVGLFVLALLVLRDRGDAPAPAAGLGHPLAALFVLARNGRLWLIAAMGALFYMPINVYGGLWGPEELIHDRGFSRPDAELAVSMLYWGMAAGSVFWGWLSDLLGHRKFLVLGTSLAMAGAFAAAFYLPGPGLGAVAVLLFLAGFFCGAQMLGFAMAKEGHRAEFSGTIIAFVNMIGIGGALLFQPLLGAIIDASGGDFGPAMLTIPASGLGAALLALCIREKRHADHYD